jgi:ribonuclease P protein component
MRLRNPAEFRTVYQCGRRAASRSFVVFSLPTRSGSARFGLTTPRKLGKAHDRNRIRRRVREILRQNNVGVGGSRDVVINPRRSVLDRDWYALRIELLALLDTTR